MDDLNYLFHRQQQERVLAEKASCTESAAAHRQMASFYEQRIAVLTEGRVDILALGGR